MEEGSLIPFRQDIRFARTADELRIAYAVSGQGYPLVRAAVPGVELERAPVMLEREVELTRVPVGVAEIVLDIGIAGVAERRRGKRLDRGAPVLRLDRLFARGVVRIELRCVRIAVVRIGRRRARDERQRDGEERAGDFWATI